MSVIYDTTPPAEDVSIVLISSEAKRNSLFPLVTASPERLMSSEGSEWGFFLTVQQLYEVLAPNPANPAANQKVPAETSLRKVLLALNIEFFVWKLSHLLMEKAEGIMGDTATKHQGVISMFYFTSYLSTST